MEGRNNVLWVPAHVDTNRRPQPSPEGAHGLQGAHWRRGPGGPGEGLGCWTLSPKARNDTDCYRQEITKERKWTKNTQSRGSQEKRTRIQGAEREADRLESTRPNHPSHEL